MIEAATDIIVARSRQTDGIQTMILWSVAAHVLLVAAVVFVPRQPVDDTPREVMTISLGGAPGPRAGGLTQAAGRSVQAPTPVEPVRRAETAPAPKTPEMTLPDPRTRTKPRPRTEQAPPQATSRTPTTGEKPNESTAPSDTRVRGQGFGLTTSGGLGGGVTLDVTNFCCQEYLEQMVTVIQRNWQLNQGVVGTTVVKFTIRRDGTIDLVEVERPSGFLALDNAATRALGLTRQLAPLPAQFPNPTLTVHLKFEYQR
jgi:protein TonB